MAPSALNRAFPLVVAAILATGCSFPNQPQAAGSPAPTGPELTSPPPTPHSSSTPNQPPPTPTPTTPPALPSTAATCAAPIAAGDNLILATIAGGASIVLRDITDLSNPRTICTFRSQVSPRFATASVVGYADGGATSNSPGGIVRLDLANLTQRTMASWASGGFGSGLFDWSPDGQSLSYIAPSDTGLAWHLLGGDGFDRVLAALGTPPGRDVSPQDDGFSVSFSPDGRYLALVESFTGGSGETAPLQVRRVSDGGLVYSATSGTMGVWASVPSRLFFRSREGALSRWDPTQGVTQVQSSLRWSRPHASPDGRWVAYTVYDANGYPRVGLYGVQSNTFQLLSTQLRSGAQFVNNTYVWYQAEALCGNNPCGLSPTQPTGATYLHDIAAATENASRVKALYDAWPRGRGGRGT